jgi:hypothetical protein
MLYCRQILMQISLLGGVMAQKPMPVGLML